MDSTTRFSVDKFVDKLPAMLEECYRSDVESRNKSLIADEATKAHIAKAAKWLSGRHKIGLLLLGTVGNGKSTLVRSIAKLIGLLYSSPYADQRKTVYSVSALDLVDIAKNNSERFDMLKRTELLAIDDVGTEPPTAKVWGNEISPLVDIIYHRYDMQLFTIMTSNLNIDDLGTRYGERVADRMFEMFDRIAFENCSYRRI